MQPVQKCALGLTNARHNTFSTLIPGNETTYKYMLSRTDTKCSGEELVTAYGIQTKVQPHFMSMSPSPSGLQYITPSVQHTIYYINTFCSLQNTACSYNLHHTAYNIQHTAYSFERIAYSIRLIAYSIRHTAHSIRHTTRSRQHITHNVHNTIDSIPHAACNIPLTAYSFDL